MNRRQVIIAAISAAPALIPFAGAIPFAERKVRQFVHSDEPVPAPVYYETGEWVVGSPYARIISSGRVIPVPLWLVQQHIEQTETGESNREFMHRKLRELNLSFLIA